MEIIVSCALCTLCKAIVLVRSLDWRLLYRRQFLRSKEVAQEDDNAGLVEGAEDSLKRRTNPRIR